MSGGAVYDKEAILDTPDARFAAVAEVDVEDVAKRRGKCDWCCGDSRFVDCRDFTNIDNWLTV